MAYEYLTQFTSPYGPKTSAKKTSITIHHWGKFGQTFQGVINYLCSPRPNNPTSAHYVVEDGRVACIVDPDNAAYHCGVNAGNTGSIGIECRPEATDGDYATVAELIRDLRRVYGDIPLKRHSDWKATACPGKWDLARLDRLARSTPTKPVDPPKLDPEDIVTVYIARTPEGTIWTGDLVTRRGLTPQGWADLQWLSSQGFLKLANTTPREVTDVNWLGQDVSAIAAKAQEIGDIVKPSQTAIQQLIERPIADVDEEALATLLAPKLGGVTKDELLTALRELKGTVSFG